MLKSRTPLIRKIMLAACALSLLAPDSNATTYFVRTTGSDANPGTSPAAAWRTIGRAALTMVAGDTVYVGAGTYNEQVSPVNDGTPSDPIKFVADTSGVMTGDAGMVEITAGGAIVDVNQDDYVHIIGFQIRDGTRGVRWRDCTGGLLQDCAIYRHSDVGVEASSAGLSVRNCVIRDNRSHGISVLNVSSVVVKSSRTNGNGGSGIHADGNETVVTLHQFRSYSNTLDGVHAERGKFSFVNCLLFANGDDGIEITAGAAGAEIWNSTIADNGDDGIRHQTGNMTITNCIVAFNDGDGLDKQSGVMNHSYNLVFGSGGQNYAGTGPGTGEISADPKFVDLAGGDFHIKTGSPAINVGTSAAGIADVDIDNYLRPMSPAWDMGCYEYLGIGAPGVRVLKWVEVR